MRAEYLYTGDCIPPPFISIAVTSNTHTHTHRHTQRMRETLTHTHTHSHTQRKRETQTHTNTHAHTHTQPLTIFIEVKNLTGRLSPKKTISGGREDPSYT